jgi:guanylate kinase
MQPNGITFIISAPSGTGKTTVCKILKQKLPKLKFSISHTTREPRDSETDGIDYHFISEENFEDKIKHDKFIEWAKVYQYYYGTAFESIDSHKKNGDDVLIELDVQGAKSLRKLNYEAIFIFILPPSLKELEIRLRSRNTESESSISDRLKSSKNEVQQFKLYDYILTNVNIEETAENIISVIKAEHLRKELYQPTSPDLRSLIDQMESH